VENAEMYRTFNMGIGMVAVVSEGDADAVLRDSGIAEFEPLLIGRIVSGSGTVQMGF